jgi:hypothetical protein
MKLLNVMAALTIRAAWCAAGLYSRTCRSPILLLRPDSPPMMLMKPVSVCFRLLLIFGFQARDSNASLVEEADEFWPASVGLYPLVTRDDFSEPLDSSFRDFHRAALSTYRAARAAFRPSCSNADAMRSISPLARPYRAASARHLETALPSPQVAQACFLVDRSTYCLVTS